MSFNQSNIILTIIQFLAATIGLAMVVYRFMNDADLVTFFGVELAMGPFVLRLYIENTTKQHKTP